MRDPRNYTRNDSAIDVEAGFTRARIKTTIGQIAKQGELSILRSPGDFAFPHMDFYVTFPTDNANAFIGSVWRAYSVIGGIRSPEGQKTLLVAPTAGASLKLLSLRNRGGVDAFEVTLQLDAAATIPVTHLESMLVTWKGGAGDTGASPPPAGGGGGSSVYSFFSMAAFAASGVISPKPCALFRIVGTLSDAAAGARWLMAFDSATVPGNGAVPILRWFVGPGVFFSDVWDARPFTLGLSFAVSTTRDTLTLAGAGDTVDVSAQVA